MFGDALLRKKEKYLRMRPDILKFNSDLTLGQFKLGIVNSKWGVEDNSNERPNWPLVLIWITAAKRENGPEKFYFQFNLDNYPSEGPTICIWDIENNKALPANKRPKGQVDFARIFRNDWEGGIHLYVPYERHSLATHPDWPLQYPSLSWKSGDCITKALEHLYHILNSIDYEGI